MVAVNVNELQVVNRMQRRSAISTGQSRCRAFRERRKRAAERPRPHPVWPLGAAALQSATTSCCLPVPLTSPRRKRWSVGSSNRSGGSASCPIVAAQPLQGAGVLGVRRRQPAPRAKSIRPSPSMSWGWMHTLSRAVALRMMSCFAQLGFSYQKTESSETATTSSFPIAVHVGHGHSVTDVADMRVDLLRLELRWVGEGAPLRNSECDGDAMRSRRMKVSDRSSDNLDRTLAIAVYAGASKTHASKKPVCPPREQPL